MAEIKRIYMGKLRCPDCKHSANKGVTLAKGRIDCKYGKPEVIPPMPVRVPMATFIVPDPPTPRYVTVPGPECPYKKKDAPNA